MRFLLDTNVVSEGAAPVPNAQVMHMLATHEGELAVSSVTVHELWFGVSRLPRSRRRTRLTAYVEAVLGGVVCLPYDDEAARWHAEERARLVAAGRTPGLADGQIAAIAVTRELVLVTRNISDFRGFRGLRVESWFGPGPRAT